MNTSDLYTQLEVSPNKKLRIACLNKADFYVLRAAIYKIRRKQLNAFAAIDDSLQADDGLELSVKWFADDRYAELELRVKVIRDWQLLPTADN